MVGAKETHTVPHDERVTVQILFKCFTPVLFLLFDFLSLPLLLCLNVVQSVIVLKLESKIFQIVFYLHLYHLFILESFI